MKRSPTALANTVALSDVASTKASTAAPSAPPTVAQSPSDVLRLAVAAVLLLGLLLVQWLWGDTLITFAGNLLQGLDALPTWLVDVVVVGTRILAVVVLVGGLDPRRPGRRRADARHLGAGRRHRGRPGRPPRAVRSVVRADIGRRDGGRLPDRGRARGDHRCVDRRRAVAEPAGSPGELDSGGRPRP